MSFQFVFAKCWCLILFLVLVAAESSAATKLPPSGASFRFSLQDQQNTVLSKCVATAVAPQWVVSAAHCFPAKVPELVAHCQMETGAKNSSLNVITMVYHETFDLVLLKLHALPDCGQRHPGLLQKLPDNAVFSSATLWPAAKAQWIEFETLQQDEFTAVLLDSDACLSRGDSGYPLYVSVGDKYLLAGMLMGGTEECPSYQQAVRLDKQLDWIQSTVALKSTAQPLNQQTCIDAPCMVVDSPGAVFCSIDPPGVRGLKALDLKSRITFKPGNFKLTEPAITALASVNVEKKQTTHNYHASRLVSVKLVRPLDSSRDDLHRLDVHAVYRAASGDQIEINFRMLPASSAAAYRLGEKDAVDFLSNGLTMRIKYPGKGSILYAPCALPGQADKEFVFMLADGTRVTARANARAGSFELGYSIGYLLHARIEKEGAVVELDDWFSLGYLGSSLSQGDLSAPALVIRTDQSGQSCGYVFDSGSWDTSDAVDGYVAYELQCDNSLGDRLPLVSVDYPLNYVFP